MITIDRRDLVPLYLSLLASLVVTQAASPPRGCSLVTTQSPIPTRLTSVWPSPCTTRWHSLHHAIPHFHYEYVSPATRREMKAASNVEVDEAASRSQSRARFSFRKYPPTTAKDAPSVTPSECTAAAAANTKRVDHHNCRHNMVATALRGGGSAPVTATISPPSVSPSSASLDVVDSERVAVNAYRLQQQLYLQSRSMALRQALIQRGLTELEHSVTDAASLQPVDWDCALATPDSPKSCLYSFDAPEGSKVIAPIDTEQWITLAALNRLRRNDPTKVEPLWHSKYSILSTWFHPNNSAFSLYTHLSPIGTVLSIMLDSPFILAAAMWFTTALVVLLTLPLWEYAVKLFLTHPILWQQWHQWGRFVHAALPLKLLLGQMAWKAFATLFASVYYQLRTKLVEWECQLYETCIPLTIVPGAAMEITMSDLITSDAGNDVDDDEDDADEETDALSNFGDDKDQGIVTDDELEEEDL